MPASELKAGERTCGTGDSFAVWQRGKRKSKVGF